MASIMGQLTWKYYRMKGKIWMWLCRRRLKTREPAYKFNGEEETGNLNRNKQKPL